MANRLIKVGNSFNVPQKYYVCEKLTDMGTLGNFGDIVLCFHDHATYMKDSNGEWKEVSLGGGGGGGAIKQLPDPTAEDEGKIAKIINGQWDIGEDSGEKQLPDVTIADNGKIAKVIDGHWDLGTESGGGGSVDALSTEEMMALFADTGLTETAGVEYVEYTEDPNGDYVYDEELGEYRAYEEGDTGTRYSADAGPAGYVEYVEDPNGEYVWDETTQTYRLYEEGDTGTRYAVGQSYILIY